MASEERVKLLWNCAGALSPETHTNKLLKSYYINTCRKLARDNIQVPKEKFGVSQMCQRCSLFWSENEFSMRLKPQTIAKNSKAKKLIARLDESLTSQTQGILSKKQRGRAKWLKKRVCSTVVLRCENCKHKSVVPLKKPQKEQNTDAAEATATIIEKAPLTKKKKKKSKKKDPTAGLIIKSITPKVTQSVTINQEIKPSTSNKKEPNTKGQVNSNVHKLKAKPSPQASDASKLAKPNLSQPFKAKKKKKYNKDNNNKITTPHQPAVKSKTQQKNSLLQLAALLKKQGSQANSQQMLLESLLE